MKSKRKVVSFFLLIAVLACLLMILIRYQTKEKTEENATVQISSDNDDRMYLEFESKPVQLDVPLENQFTEPALGNGCEVTALSMLLNYYDYDTNKNQLAEQLNYVPLFDEDEGYFGDPREGFVGDINGGDDAMGVAVEPIAELAKSIVSEPHQVISGRGKDFAELLEILASGNPVWMIATLELQVPTEDDFLDWETANGNIEVTGLNHSVVITGIDGNKVYVNDPYGEKNREMPLAELAEIYQRMGQQYLYLT